MAKKKSVDKYEMHEAGPEALEAAQAKEAGADFEWHFGRVTRLGHFEIAGGRGVSILWEEGGATSLGQERATAVHNRPSVGNVGGNGRKTGRYARDSTIAGASVGVTDGR